MSSRFATPLRLGVRQALVSPPSGRPRSLSRDRVGSAERSSAGDGETGFYLRRSWTLVERMRAAVAERRAGL